MTLSQGAKKDLLIINLVLALFMVRKSDEAKRDADIIFLANATHIQNKKIEVFCVELETKLRRTMEAVIQNSKDSSDVVYFMRNKWKTLGVELIMSIIPKTNLELLCNQILFYNFCDRKKPLLSEYAWLQDEKQHFAMFGLVGTNKGL